MRQIVDPAQLQAQPLPPAPLEPVQAPEVPEEEEDFAAMLEASFKHVPRGPQQGQAVTGPIVKIAGDLAFVDLGGKSEGVIDLRELRDAEGDLVAAVGDLITATITGTGGDEGTIRLSRQISGGPHARERLRDAFENGLPVEGKVASRNPGGYEVQVAGVRAFVPGSQIDAQRGTDPDSHVGKSYQFLITEIKGDRRDIILSRAKLQKQEAEARAKVLRETLKEGDVVTGRVRGIQDFGAFVDLGGLDGLLPVSELSWSRVKHPSEVVQVGDQVNVQVLRYDRDANRISLSLRALASSPWNDVGVRFVEGGTYSGRITRLESFGAFVELAPGLEGLIHISDMVWDRRLRHPREVVNPGDHVQVQILTLDLEKRRIGLGMKQVQGDPWEGIFERFPVGSIVEGTVERVAPFGVFLTLQPGVTGLIPNSELNTQRGSDTPSQFPVGQVVRVQVLDVNPEERRMSLSRKSLDESGEREAYRAYQANRSAQKAPPSAEIGTFAAAGGLGELLSKVKVRPMPVPTVEAGRVETLQGGKAASAEVPSVSASPTQANPVQAPVQADEPAPTVPSRERRRIRVGERPRQ